MSWESAIILPFQGIGGNNREMDRISGDQLTCPHPEAVPGACEEEVIDLGGYDTRVGRWPVKAE